MDNMENNQVSNQDQSSMSMADGSAQLSNTGRSKKSLIIIVAIVAIAALFLIWLRLSSNDRFGTPNPTSSISPSPSAPQLNIDQELNSLNLGNIDQEFQSVDKDLNSL